MSTESHNHHAFDEERRQSSAVASERDLMAGRVLAIQMLLATLQESAHAATADALSREVEALRDSTVALQLERDQALERVARATNRMLCLQLVTEALSAALTPIETAEVIVEQGLAALGASGVLVVLRSPDATSLRVLASSGYPAGVLERWQEVPASSPAPWAEAVRIGEALWIESPKAWNDRYPALTQVPAQTGNRSWAVLPLRLDGYILGALTLAFRQERIFDSDERGLLQGLSHHCAQALERTRLYEVEWQAYEAAEAAELRYRSLFEQAADVLIVTDEQGTICEVNATATRLLGYSRDDLLGKRIAESGLVASGPDWVEAEFARLRKTGLWQGECALRRRDGSLLPVECRVVAVDLPAGIVYRGTCRDITDRKHLQQLQREFLALVAHELGNPLTSIKGYLQLMERRTLGNDPTLVALLRQVDHLHCLIHDLHETAQLEVGQFTLRRESVDLIDFARDCAAWVHSISQQHRVRLEAPRGPLVGSWDPNRLRRVLQNLLSNAVKYWPRGGEIVLQVQDEGAHARIAVIDQGHGIRAEDRPYLFERFYRAEAARAGTTEGSGLGLSMAKALVEAHGGRIWAESEPARGSTFTVVLPYQPLVSQLEVDARLTPRQLEVATQVAQGKTNREIAEALILTVGTVSNHVHHIMNKLDFHSRAQIAAWVAEHGISPRFPG